ncbi:MAG: glycogen/starch synthase [Nitrososphaerota archaeon]|nr:glycogen/starch synthase [Nitrososphaerota archaeon]
MWFIAFESQRVASAGGLGNAVANLSEELSREGMAVTVFLPSHGMHLDEGVRERLNLRDTKVALSGARIGYDGSPHPYSIGVEEGSYSGVRYRLFKGLDRVTSRWLDERSIYGGDEATYQKTSLLARALRGYVEGKIVTAEEGSGRPSVIHMHDWHAVPAGVSAWQAFAERGKGVCRPALVFTSHLLGFKRLPWHYMSADWSGLKEPRGGQYIWVDGSFSFRSGFKEVWEAMSGGSFEKFGAYEADFVTSVSRSYLAEEVLGFVGQGIGGKSDFVHNGCDWDYQDMRKAVAKTLGPKEERGGASLPTRDEVRRFLLEEVLAEKEDREGFNRDGPLALMTGRFDRQKGVDVLLEAVPSVLKQIPESRFLLLLLPSGGNDSYADEVVKGARALSDNVRLVEGNSAGVVYQLAYLASDVYVIPSRWEPFGITALEAMATGNPVVGASTGGIKETVVDILEDEEGGTGRLVPPGDSRELARGIVSFLTVMMISRGAKGSTGSIAYESLRAAVEEDFSFGAKLRERCIKRVKENFTWAHAARKTDACYRKAGLFAEARSSAKY